MPPALAAAFIGIKGSDRKRESIGKKAISRLFNFTCQVEMQKSLNKELQTELFRECRG